MSFQPQVRIERFRQLGHCEPILTFAFEKKFRTVRLTSAVRVLNSELPTHHSSSPSEPFLWNFYFFRAKQNTPRKYLPCSHLLFSLTLLPRDFFSPPLLIFHVAVSSLSSIPSHPEIVQFIWSPEQKSFSFDQRHRGLRAVIFVTNLVTRKLTSRLRLIWWQPPKIGPGDTG